MNIRRASRASNATGQVLESRASSLRCSSLIIKLNTKHRMAIIAMMRLQRRRRRN
jgi:hypothetical protein